MLETGEVLRLLLATLGLGVALPIMVQLFLAIREIRLTVRRISDQLEPGLRRLQELADRPRDVQPAASQVGPMVAALIPAFLAAYQAFRQQQHQAADEPDSDLPATATPEERQ
jgi:F0F1-type ATP synthase assembly protein I